MKNEVLYNNNTSKSFISEKTQLLSKSQIVGHDYSTITIQTNQSLVITDKSESFDLYKGMFFMFCSCISFIKRNLCAFVGGIFITLCEFSSLISREDKLAEQFCLNSGLS